MIPPIETAPPHEIKAFQEQKLREALAYVSQNSPFYKSLFERHGCDPAAITTLGALERLPVTTKEDLQDHNDSFLCVPRSMVADYSTTSGTSGRPVTFALTDKDLDRLAYNEAVSFACSGIAKGDVVQLMTTIDRRFMAGLAYFLGLRRLGAGVVRTGAGIPELQWDSILRYGPRYLITVPSFLLKLIDYAEANGIDYNNSGIVGAICIGEPIRNDDFSPNVLSEKITGKWNIKLFSTYASTEMNTAFAECAYSCGGHHHPGLIIAEVLDDSNKPVPQGQAGELTITTLGVEGMPLVRFKTGDIVQAHTEPCRCGRTTMRLGPVTGRKQQMIKYKGTTLYPPAMANLLHAFSEVTGHIIEISTNNTSGTDEILVKIAARHPSAQLLTQVKDHFRAKLRVTPTIVFVTESELNEAMFAPMSRKPVTFIDRRI